VHQLVSNHMLRSLRQTQRVHHLPLTFPMALHVVNTPDTVLKNVISGRFNPTLTRLLHSLSLKLSMLQLI
jgi:hypothetical protein